MTCEGCGQLVAKSNAGAKELLQSLSEKQGREMNSIESAKEIPKFLEFFKAWGSSFLFLFLPFLFCYPYLTKLLCFYLDTVKHFNILRSQRSYQVLCSCSIMCFWVASQICSCHIFMFILPNVMILLGSFWICLSHFISFKLWVMRRCTNQLAL